MIYFFTENNFIVKQKNKLKQWIKDSIEEEKCKLGEINYIFCSDDYLLDINIKHLNHNFYTDIVTFDYRENNTISGELFISTDRVKDNSKNNKTLFEEELHRVIIHGILHIIGYNDKSEEEIKIMREKENYYLEKFKLLQQK